MRREGISPAESGSVAVATDSLRDRIDVDLAIVLVTHGPVDEREEREVRALSDVAAGMEDRAALTDDDRPGGDELTAVALDAAELRVAVAAVAEGAGTFLVCHGAWLLGVDGRDRELWVRVA